MSSTGTDQDQAANISKKRKKGRGKEEKMHCSKHLCKLQGDQSGGHRYPTTVGLSLVKLFNGLCKTVMNMVHE